MDTSVRWHKREEGQVLGTTEPSAREAGDKQACFASRRAAAPAGRATPDARLCLRAVLDDLLAQD